MDIFGLLMVTANVTVENWVLDAHLLGAYHPSDSLTTVTLVIGTGNPWVFCIY